MFFLLLHIDHIGLYSEANVASEYKTFLGSSKYFCINVHLLQNNVYTWHKTKEVTASKTITQEEPRNTQNKNPEKLTKVWQTFHQITHRNIIKVNICHSSMSLYTTDAIPAFPQTQLVLSSCLFALLATNQIGFSSNWQKNEMQSKFVAFNYSLHCACVRIITQAELELL